MGIVMAGNVAETGVTQFPISSVSPSHSLGTLVGLELSVCISFDVVYVVAGFVSTGISGFLVVIVAVVAEVVSAVVLVVVVVVGVVVVVVVVVFGVVVVVVVVAVVVDVVADEQ